MLKEAAVFLISLTDSFVGSIPQSLAREPLPAHLQLAWCSDDLSHASFHCRLFHTWSTPLRLNFCRILTRPLEPCSALAIFPCNPGAIEGNAEARVGRFGVDAVPRHGLLKLCSGVHILAFLISL